MSFESQSHVPIRWIYLQSNNFGEYLMRLVTVVGIATTSTAVAVLAFVSVTATLPTESSEVDDTVRALESDGYHVAVNHVGAASFFGCDVTAIRPESIADIVYVEVAC
jgi:hypothetical protein